MRVFPFQPVGRVSRHCLLALVAITWMGVYAYPADAQQWTYNTSLRYSTGTYIFSERTHTLAFTHGLGIRGDRYDLSFSIPLLYQSSPWISYTPIGGVPSGGPQQDVVRQRRGRHASTEGQSKQSGSRSRDTVILQDTVSYQDVGIGDPSVSASFALITSKDQRPSIRLTASAKAPVADEDSGFGTGAWDGALGLRLTQRVETWFLFADVAYWWLGDLDGLELNDSIAYSASIGRAFLDGQLGALISVAGYEAEIIDNVEPPVQVGAGLSYFLDNGSYGINTSFYVGISESVPGFSTSIGGFVRF
ncbi:hypothetical protein CRI94_11980 [Longibacter salinarum]|uniref:Transporter n=1 Tax=Longibacter salinarum TaxID=1850348 RepID=A0A2A8CVW1_9BACT|nr:transporter [Longibacter salinarum]PEN12740.1 hypothetical protein CRI94_11980 [Longibacter salinarum]